MDATVWEEVHDIKGEAISEVKKNEDDSDADNGKVEKSYVFS